MGAAENLSQARPPGNWRQWWRAAVAAAVLLPQNTGKTKCLPVLPVLPTGSAKAKCTN